MEIDPFCFGFNNFVAAPPIIYLYLLLSPSITIHLNANVYIPHTEQLKNVISSVWQTEGVTSFCTEHIIPKGVIEIIFNFSEGLPIQAMLNNQTYTLSRCFINGFNTAPIEIHLPARQIFFGVQFHPLAIKKILKVPAREFTDHVVDMTLVDSTFNSLWHRLAEQQNFHQRVAVLSHWLQTVFTRCEPQEIVVNHFLSVINQHDLTVKELASTVCYSPRQLARRMIEATGLNTEEILLYKKYLHAVHLIHHTELALTNIAYQSHFADQSHFIKSFRHFTNMTPGDYRANKGHVKGHIYKNVR